MVNEGISQTDVAALGDAATSAGAALDKLIATSTRTGDTLSTLGSFAHSVRAEFSSFNDAITKWNVSLNNTKNLTEQQTVQLSLFNTAVLGVRDSFTSFSTVGKENINTFADQLQYLEDTFGNTHAAIGKMVQYAKEAFNTMVPTEIIAKGAGAVKTFVEQLAKSADNALRVQNAYIQLSAKTGNLSQVFAAAGPNLEKLNALLEKQTAMIGEAVTATGAAPEVVQNYYSQLGTIPKALEETVKTGTSSNETISMLTASIKLATGTGRDYADVMNDLKIAFQDYNLTGEPALKFTARISEISNKFGTNLDVVRESLRNTASTFKLFGDQSEGATKILNNYVGALKATHISGDLAIDVVTQMTQAIGSMGIAQKAFLSAQTGGPGGLMGAFQIEKMLRDGKVDEVFEKIRTQMQKQFGKIVTLEDAAKSPAAAAQMTRQMMILQQGPLGKFAKDDQTSMRILEAFKSRAEGKGTPTDLSTKIVQDSVDKGTLVQEKSYTELSRIRGILETGRGATDIANLGYVQKGTTVSAGIPAGEVSSSQAAMQQGLKGTMTRAGVRSGQIGQDLGREIKTKAPVMDVGKRIVSSINEIYMQMKDLPQSMKAPLDALKNVIKSGKTRDWSESAKGLEDEIARAKVDAAKKPKEERDKIMAAVNKEEQILKAMKEDKMAISRDPQAARKVSDFRKYAGASEVGVAAGQVAGMTRTGAGGLHLGKDAGAVRDHKMAAVSEKMGDVFVHVTGYCIKCKQQIDGGDQVASLNPAGVNT